MTYSTLRMTIGGLVLATVLALAGIAKAEHENMTEVGDNVDNIVFNAGLNICDTLQNVKNAVAGNVAPTCGMTNRYLMGNVIIVDTEEVNGKTFVYAQVTFVAVMLAPNQAMPMPPTVTFVVWNVVEPDGKPA